MARPLSTEFDVVVGARAELGEGPRWDAVTQTSCGSTSPRIASIATTHDAGRDTAARTDVVRLALPRRRGGVVIGLPDGLHLLDGEGSPLIVAIDPNSPSRAPTTAPATPPGGSGSARWRSTSVAARRAVPCRRRPCGDGGPLRHDDLERARLEPVGARVLLHRQSDAPRRRVRLRPGDGRPREPAAVRRRRGRGRRPRRHVRRRRGRRLGALCTAAGGSTAIAGRRARRRVYGLPGGPHHELLLRRPDLRDLYVTTRRERLSDAELAAQPLAGALLRFDAGVAGLPTHAFAG